MLRKEKEEVLIETQQLINLETGIATELQFRVITIPHDNRIFREENKAQMQQDYAKSIKYFRYGKKQFLAESKCVVLPRLVLNMLTRVNI